jgi:DNA-binding NarL/FixJ family response regulator
MSNLINHIRIILADDHTLVRAGIRALLEKMPGVTVVAEAANGREVFELVKAHQPDVVLMDIAMPGLNGLEATARIVSELPATRVVLLSMHDNDEYVARALKAGAAGYLVKKAATSELATALERVMRKEIYLSKEINDRFQKKPPLDLIANRKSPVEELTERQREILQLIAEGQNTKSIAEILKVSPKTIEYHRMKLMDRLNVHDIAGLVRFALRVGLVPQES